MAAEPLAGHSGPRAVGPVPTGVPDEGRSTPVLLDGSAEGRLLPHLIDRLRDPDLDRIDMAVSFVMKSGLARILRPLEDALDRGARVRILTTDYLAITDPDALTQLADLAEGGDRRLEMRLWPAAPATPSISTSPKSADSSQVRVGLFSRGASAESVCVDPDSGGPHRANADSLLLKSEEPHSYAVASQLSN